MKKLGQFVTNVNDIELSPGNYENILSKSKSLKTKGLFNFIRQKKLLESVSQRLNYEDGKEMLELKIYEGIVHGCLGRLDKAVDIFNAVINQTEDKSIKTISYLNIAWLYMSLDRKILDTQKTDEAKKYIDLAYDYFDLLSDDMKHKILSNYSVYYYLNKEYDKAIEILNDSIKYCQEKDLADLYNTLVELNLKLTSDSNFSEHIKEYLEKAEIVGTKHDKFLSLGQTFYLRAEVELREDQFFSALDTLYLSFDYFKQAEATVLAYDCLLKINQLTDEYEQHHLKTLKNNLKKSLKGTDGIC